MKNILAPANRAKLHEFAQQRVLLAFDFDGTLAPIARTPEAAALPARTYALLAKVAKLYSCVVISGRARADLQKRLAGLRLRAVIGNHGMEPSPNLREARWLSALWQAELVLSLPKISGVRIEDKGVSLAVHYRLARARVAARRRILLATAELHGARLVEGKMVVNVLPASAPDKGTALLRLCKRFACESIIFVGDDDTDEDAFALAGQTRLLGIRVGRSRRSQAAYFVSDQTAVAELLAELAGLPVANRTPGFH